MPIMGTEVHGGSLCATYFLTTNLAKSLTVWREEVELSEGKQIALSFLGVEWDREVSSPDF
jgi:hypothetical protein